jgi:hypothetical protein
MMVSVAVGPTGIFHREEVYIQTVKSNLKDKVEIRP